MTFISGWAGCYNADLHGSFEWYTIKGGSKAHLDAINKTVTTSDVRRAVCSHANSTCSTLITSI